MPTPTIPAGNLFMNATLWTGNNGTASITNGVAGQSFQPDFVWVKNRTNAYTHLLYDSVRGVGTLKAMSSSETNAEGNMSDNSTFGYLSALNSNGFTVVSGSTANSYTNSSGNNYVGWQWKAGGAATTITVGSVSPGVPSIASSVSANTTSGFSVVTYTGTGSLSTVGHGLGVTPSMIIVKRINSTGDWAVYNSNLSGGANNQLLLNSTAQAPGSSSFWGNSPNSTTFSVWTSSTTNASGGTFVAYCWAAIAGYSAFGSYTGNGSTDGPFIYTGFRPRFVMFKRTDTTANWTIRDTARNPYNSANLGLFPNRSDAEDSTAGRDVDILSNGFKIRGTDSDLNTNGGTYIYMAFCENPLKYANAC